MDGLKKSLIGVAAATMLASSPAVAQDQDQAPEIRVGIIDVKGNELTFSDRRTKIEYRAFTQEGKFPGDWMTESGADHGQMMASAFVRELRRIDPAAPVRIFAANAFQENSGTGSAKYTQSMGLASKRTLSVNWEGATHALEWFKANNVKVVLTAFNGSDSQQLRTFMQKANSLGMAVFASAGNKVGGSIYPAAYPEAISVAGDNKDLAFRKDASISRWVNFTMDGGVPMGIKGAAVDEGSSFATAKAAAFGAYYSAHNPSAGRDQIASALRDAAVPQIYSVQDQQVRALRFDETSAGKVAEIAREEARIAAAGQLQEPLSAETARDARAPAPSRNIGAIASATGMGL